MEEQMNLRNFLSSLGVDVGGRWKRLYETCLPHLDDHVLAFNDLHFLMAFLGAGQREIADKLLQSISAFVRYFNGLILFQNFITNCLNNKYVDNSRCFIEKSALWTKHYPILPRPVVPKLLGVGTHL